MQISPGKKIFFLSDFHLGAPDYESSLEREKRIVRFLNTIQNDASHIFLVGDMFDFWFEYKKVVPKGFVRILGKLAEMTDSGIVIKFFVGNHDMWMNGYFQKELGIEVFFEPAEFQFNKKLFYIAHGDGLGPGDHRYKFIKKIFRNRFSQWLFGFLHPHTGIGLANYMSRKSRAATGKADEEYFGEDKEWLIIFSKQMLNKKHYDYFIYGHRHLPMDISLNESSRYLNLGDWIKYFSYAEFDGENIALKYYEL
ncbi:MAG: UDP-2,3-diacylglucosamine diphosphatase [Ginsengibacter sp.]